ncbi:hypothetical protein [Bacteroides sp. 51]|uniref:hypothetical protein n=1 Tax=Bacteroides sp. 51 TaxID=2302938 RepID=UPI0013D461C7|nr:hypothetical protein [Bacteroides sp. 51]NDV81855.1 hypothetical protein [Bacteroides sp. 51]
MKQIKIAGVKRHTLFSPNHIGNDAAIFSAVTNLLSEAGFIVNLYTEQEFLVNDITEDVVFTMLRNEQAVRKLQQLENGGIIAVNSGYGIENCTRERMTRLLLENNVPHPESLIISTMEEVTTYASGRDVAFCWVKRGDFHAIHREDVTYVRNKENLREVMAEYALRGINRVVINEHLEGDLVKFYGVAGTPFFHWFYPFDKKHSKFGHEEINGKPEGIHFDMGHLKDICDKASEALSVMVYGGDCIIAPDGTIRIIDFNDWPSFAPCREEAAHAIASAIIEKIKK